MAYGNLTIGSRGDEVKKLQQYLIDSGYDIGSYGLDGVYGNDTANAVKKYQQDNGLAVDGIAGNNTLSKMYSTPSSKPQDTSGGQKENNKYTYDPNTNHAYLDALEALKKAQENMPQYSGKWDEQLQAIYDQIVNRKDFTYDLNSDALYQQYKDQYAQMGQMAMMDTMGQASAMTGGYGNSYAQGVGQQAYQGYLQQLNDKVPELYGIALDQYNQEGQDLLNQYSMLGDLANDEYAKYQDALNQYWQQLNYQKQLADQEYERGFNEWQTEYGVQKDAYQKLVSLITTTGYKPSADDLAKAGMSQSEADAYLDYYTKANTPRYSGGGGGGGSSSSGEIEMDEKLSETMDRTKKLQQFYKDKGLYNGPIDGAWTGELNAAMKQYNDNKFSYQDVIAWAMQKKMEGKSNEEIESLINDSVNSIYYVANDNPTVDRINLIKQIEKELLRFG